MTDEIRDLLGLNKLIIFIGPWITAEQSSRLWHSRVSRLSRKLKFVNAYKDKIDDDFKHSQDYRTYINYKKSIYETKRAMNEIYKQAYKIRTYRLINLLHCYYIYTTNQDSLIEYAFGLDNVIKVVTADDLKQMSLHRKQIIKYRGDFEYPESLIEIANSYDVKTPLDWRLTEDIKDNSILFLGYEPSDRDLQFLLFKIEQLWNEKYKNLKRPKGYIYLHKPNLYSKFLSAHNIQLIKTENDIGIDNWLEELLNIKTSISPV